MAEKYCSKCGEKKPLSAFRRRKGRKNARVARCLSCEAGPRKFTVDQVRTSSRDQSRPPGFVYVYAHTKRCRLNSQGGRPCIYVGSTELTPEQRLEKQREGGRSASRSARALGVGDLLPDLFAHLNPLESREAADEQERRLAQELKKQNWCVHGGTGGTPFDRFHAEEETSDRRRS